METNARSQATDIAILREPASAHAGTRCGADTALKKRSSSEIRSENGLLLSHFTEHAAYVGQTTWRPSACPKPHTSSFRIRRQLILVAVVCALVAGTEHGLVRRCLGSTAGVAVHTQADRNQLTQAETQELRGWAWRSVLSPEGEPRGLKPNACPRASRTERAPPTSYSYGLRRLVIRRGPQAALAFAT
jgi:hypothetical protein